MPFAVQYLRLTNSGKLPDLFLTSKIQGPTDLADSKAGKLFFVLQINQPWSHVASIGSSVINLIGREYYRLAGNIPLENFEYALAKANRLIEQLSREGEIDYQNNFHALVALAVGDEFHLAYAGEAEAYLLRDGKLGLITEPGSQKGEEGQTFTNLISGEISASDIIFLGSPSIFSLYASDELEQLLRQPIREAGKQLARRLQQLKTRQANAIIINFESLRTVENAAILPVAETIYIDQPIDSAWQTFLYYSGFIARPVSQALVWLGELTLKLARDLLSSSQKFWQKFVLPRFASVRTQQESKPPVADLSFLANRLKKVKIGLPKLASDETTGPGVTVHHYSARKKTLPLNLIYSLVRELRKALSRSPRLWYITIALIILTAIGASIQTHRARGTINPAVSAATIEEMKNSLKQANEAKVFGNKDKARQLLLEVVNKGEQAKKNSKLAVEASTLVGAAERELDTLSGATRINPANPLVSITNSVTTGTVMEGVFYATGQDGQFMAYNLTGGEPLSIAHLPDNQAAGQILAEPTNGQVYLQTYTGLIYRYTAASKKFERLNPAEGSFVLGTGLGWFGDTLYILDPAAGQIWKHTLVDKQFGVAEPYLKNNKVNTADMIGLAIDGAIFTLNKSGGVTKFNRGVKAEFSPHDIPSPFDKISNPLGFFAATDSGSYYLVDKGEDKIQPRIIELDKTGKFIHQYLLPSKWGNDIKLVIANPKSHKAWVLVNKDLYEFTLVQ